MKAIARSFVYWPGIDNEIEGFVKRCNPIARWSTNNSDCDQTTILDIWGKIDSEESMPQMY